MRLTRFAFYTLKGVGVFMETRFQIGVITSTHGVRGEVKVFPTTDDMKRFKRLKTVILADEKSEKIVAVEQVKFFKQFVILKLEGIDDMDQANKLRRSRLLVERKDAVPLRKDEYYRADLLGLRILDEEEQCIGELTDVMETGANDVYEINMTDGRSFLLHAIKQCVLEVKPEEGFMKIHILEGLLDE